MLALRARLVKIKNKAKKLKSCLKSKLRGRPQSNLVEDQQFNESPNILDFTSTIRQLIKSGNLTVAENMAAKSLEEDPSSFDFLIAASDVARAKGNHEAALEHSKALIKYHPRNSNGYARAAIDCQKLADVNDTDGQLLEACYSYVSQGLEIKPNNNKLLTIGAEIFAKTGKTQQALEYAEALIANQPDNWKGYLLAAQSSSALQNYDQAQDFIDRGLFKFPDHYDLLLAASDISRTMNDVEKSIERNQSLIACHPNKSAGYKRAATDLLKLGRIDQAKELIGNGLNRFPTNLRLLLLANEAYRTEANYERSLEYARLIILNHPEVSTGYKRAIQDLMTLERSNEALQIINDGLSAIPDEPSLILFGIEINEKQETYDDAVGYAQALIKCSPMDWVGYASAAKSLIALGKNEQALSTLDIGLSKLPGHKKLLSLREAIVAEVL